MPTSSRHATIDDLRLPELSDRDNGIFYGVSDATLDVIVHRSKVLTYSPDEPLFTKTSQTDNLPLFIVLDGLFKIMHEWGNKKNITVAMDPVGNLIGDVEMLLKNCSINPIIISRKTESAENPCETAWANVLCAGPLPGKVLRILPAEAILGITDLADPTQQGDYRVALNLSRLLAIKLLRRSAEGDPKVVFQARERILAHLKSLIRYYGLKPSSKKGEPEVFLLDTNVKQAEIANELNLSAASVSNVFRKLSPECRYVNKEGKEVRRGEDGFIRVTQNFLETEIPDYEKYLKLVR